MEDIKKIEKKNAAAKAAKEVKNGQVIGVGSGSTVSYFIEEIGRRIKEEELRIQAVTSSFQSHYELIKHGVPLTTLDEHPLLDMTIDGADEVDKNLNLIKGGGAALTQEKIIARYTKKLIIIVDSSKFVETLGQFPLPIEVIPKATTPVKNYIKQLGATPKIRLGIKKMGPIITDNGNFILDCQFNRIEKPEELEKELNNIPGIVENGLFTGLTDTVYIGKGDTIIIKTK